MWSVFAVHAGPGRAHGPHVHDIPRGVVRGAKRFSGPNPSAVAEPASISGPSAAPAAASPASSAAPAASEATQSPAAETAKASEAPASSTAASAEPSASGGAEPRPGRGGVQAPAHPAAAGWVRVQPCRFLPRYVGRKAPVQLVTCDLRPEVSDAELNCTCAASPMAIVSHLKARDAFGSGHAPKQSIT